MIRNLLFATVVALLLPSCETNLACGAPDLLVGGRGEHVVGSTVETGNHAYSTCGGRETHDFVARIVAPEAGFYRVSTDHPGTDFDSILALFWDCEDPVGSQLVCQGAGNGGGEFVDIYLNAEEAIYVAVDGGPGAFELTVDDTHGLALDREVAREVPPNGVAVAFRALSPYDGPVPPLQPEDVEVINDQTGLPFSASAEGGAGTYLGPNDAAEAWSILALDFSHSIFDSGAEGDVVAGAQAYIDATLNSGEGELPHKVAILAFGAPDLLGPVSEFTDDPVALRAALESARAQGDRGSTDLYGAYIEAVRTIDLVGSEDALVDRFVVVMTDGTHEAGDIAQRRAIALTEQRGTDATIFTVGIRGDYDPDSLAELASSPSEFLQVEQSGDLVSAFEAAAERTLALARSNYVVGICTPVALGDPSLTLRVTSGNDEAHFTVHYSTENLDGSIQSCDPRTVADLAFPAVP